MGTFTLAFDLHVKDLNAASSAKMAEIARNVEADVSRGRGSIPPGVIRAVDGDQNKPLEQVKPTGQIVLLFDYRPEIIGEVFQELIARSPVGGGRDTHPGLFRYSHFAIVDGHELGPLEIPTAAQVQDVQQIVITNRQPYAARIEKGITKSGRSFSTKSDVFEGAMEAVYRLYHSVAGFSYGFTKLEGAYQRSPSGGTFRRHLKSRQVRHRGAGTDIQYPAIFINRL